MELKRRSAGSAVYDYPVELVWRSISNDKNAKIEPIDDETFNAAPPENVIYTRAVELKTNELFRLQMKSRRFEADWQFTLVPLAACRTRLEASVSVTYNSMKDYLLAGAGGGVHGEIRIFLRSVGDKLKKSVKAPQG